MKKGYLYIIVVALLAALFSLHTTLRDQRVLLADERARHTSLLNSSEQERQTLMAEVEHYRTLSGQNGASVEALRLRTAELERLRAADAELIRSLRISLRRTELLATSITEGKISFTTPLLPLAPTPPAPPAPPDSLTSNFGASTTPTDNSSGNTLALRDGAESRAFQQDVEGRALQHELESLPLRDKPESLPPLPRSELAPSVCDTLAFGGSGEGLPSGRFEWSDPWNHVEGVIVGDSVTCTLRTTDTIRQVIHRVPRRFLFFRFGTRALRQEIISSNPHNTIIYSELIKIDK